MATYNLTTGNDNFTGTIGDDVFDGNLAGQTGGTDTLNGGGGNDIFTFDIGNEDYDFGNFLSGTLDGGVGGTDTVEIYGWHGPGAIQRADLGSMVFSNVEVLKVLGGQYVRLDATIAQLSAFSSIINTDGSQNFRVRIELQGAGGTIDFSTRMSGSAVTVFADSFNLTGGYAITGTAYGDQLDGSKFNDTLYGGNGHDFISTSNGTDVIDAGAGDDELYAYDDPYDNQPTAFAGTVDGGDGNDVLYSDGGSGTFEISEGDLGTLSFSRVETLRAPWGLVTGTIAQLNSFATIGSAYDTQGQIEIKLRGAGGTLDLSTRLAPNMAAHVHQAAAGVSGSLIVTGAGQNDTLEGSAYADTLNGGGGNDELKGGTGLDSLTGGLGNDTYYLEDLATATSEPYDTVVEGLNAGTDTVVVTALHNPAFIADFYSLGANVENMIALGTVEFELDGNALANALTGNDAANILQGLAGNDTLTGNDGDDAAYGGDNNDTIYTSDGADTLDGGDGRDTIAFDRAMVADWQSGILDSAIASDSWAGWEVIQGSSGADRIRTNSWGFQVELRGGGGNDSLAAGVSGLIGDILDGGDGNDTMDGGAGADTLTGGLGNDTYLNPYGDVIVEGTGAASGTDTVMSDATFDLTNVANVERLFLTGTNAIDGTGNTLNNQFIGNDKVNVINGRDGNDTINGGGGADTISGGSGLDRLIGGLQRDKIVPGTDNVQDTIVFTLIGESTGQTRDVIMGLDLNNEDKLDLPGAVSSIAAARSGALSLATFNTNLASAFAAAALPVGSAALFTATSGDLVNPNMVYLIVDANGIAGYQANQDYVFQLENHSGALDTSDFI